MLPRPALRGEGWGEGQLAAAEVIQGARRSPSPGTRACAQVPTSPRTRGEVRVRSTRCAFTTQAAAVTYANFCSEVLGRNRPAGPRRPGRRLAAYESSAGPVAAVGRWHGHQAASGRGVIWTA